jgi:exosortase
LTSTTEASIRPKRGPAGLADEPVWAGLAVTSWVKLVSLSALFVLLFWPNLWRLWGKTYPFGGEAEWQHAMFIPIIGLYYLYANREQLAAARVRPGWLGAPITLLGILLFGYGIWPGQNDFIKDFGMVVSLFGVVALVCGWGVMKIAWFPITFLVCGIPWPGLVYSWIAGPLQRLAAQIAVVVLQFTGVDAECTGTKIIMPGVNGAAGRTLNVAEACSGLKSLMTFVTVAAAIAFLSPRPLWQKIVIVLFAVPIAIFCNVMRVTGQGLLDHYVSTQLSESFAHQFVGLLMLIPAFFLILLVGWVLDKLFIDEIEDKRQLQQNLIVRKSSAVHADGRPA